ncbi:hypothetical protein DM01DRAFT_319551 [Hesseltinella vesiculosa]|uniref:C2H2-type domain-containing protein n=1 Tax=Hesseltinella vesiculosa TaxID=101127 RepID=A0A1X2GCS4_9FUNG|nr:hypothetical protein DM01DRAFT_319551 [Hesseltinella vesiculosa]
MSDNLNKVFSCTQCSKMFATRSNLKRHMENPNIHNIPYVRSRDQKRWKGHAKKVVSKEETTERMRKWRAENREKNRQNDLRCRVYRLARQKYGEQDSEEKQTFIREEIARRLGRRNGIKKEPPTIVKPTTKQNHTSPWKIELPFYNFPLQKIELPSIDSFCPPLVPSTNLRRRTSSSSESSISTTDEPMVVLPPVHALLYGQEENKPLANATNVKYVKNAKILDEFVGVVLDYTKDERH